MDHFNYRNHILHAEDVSLETIAQEVGTPFYCYSTATLVRHYKVFAEAFASVKATICFAVKANSNLAVLKTLANEGAGADCVSEGEIRRALAASVPASKIVFSGVGKTREEMAYALKQGIFQFNVESEPELRALSEVASSLGTRAPIAIRINPDVDGKTHHKITTGKKENKFGVNWENARAIYALAATLPAIDIKAISTHIGSQLLDLEPFRQAFKKVEELLGALRSDGHNITRLDLGGGLGIPYDGEEPPTPRLYADMTIEATKHLGCELIFEPGRLIAGNAGILVAKVIYVKKTDSRDFLIVDAAMNDLIRPSFYEAYHEILPIREAADNTPEAPIDIVGPVCETGDIFAKQRFMPKVGEGELVAFRSSGAYGAVMASTYNSRLLVPEVIVQGDKFAVIRKRPTYDELLGLDSIPEWV
jgi:diaminopimelate decarboxylase